MSAGLVKGEGFAVDASVMEADASRYHSQAPGETDWSATERQTRAVAEFLSSLDDEGSDADRKLPKVTDPWLGSVGDAHPLDFVGLSTSSSLNVPEPLPSLFQPKSRC